MPTAEKWTTNALAIEFGINNKTMKKRLDGLEPYSVSEGGVNYYLLADVWTYLLEKEHGKLNPSHEAAKLNQVKRERAQFDLEVKRGEYLSVAEVEQAIVEPVLNAKAKILAMASKVATLVPGITTVEEAQKVIGDQVREALNEISTEELAAGLGTTAESEDQ